jgi:hypothetical protein
VAVDVTQLLGGALGGALASSVLGPLIAQRRERRDVRADVLRAIGAVERARWAPFERDDFRATLIDLRSAALVAGVNREAVDRYVDLAQVAHQVSADTWEKWRDEEGRSEGAIPGSLSNLTTRAAMLLTDEVWHPYRRRWSIRRGLRQLKSDEEKLRNGPESVVDSELRQVESELPWDEGGVL